MKISNELREKYQTRLLSEQIVAKELGIPKKAVQELISSGALQAVEVSGKALVPILSLASMLGEKETVDFGQHGPVLQTSEEVTCSLTNNVLVQDIQEEVKEMIYTGTISTLKDGRFMVQINKGKKANGSRDRESKGFKDKTQAQKYLDSRLAQLNGTNSVQVPMAIPIVQTYTMPDMSTYTDKTFEQYAVDTLNGGVGKAASRTVEGYRTSLISVCKYIGKKKMVDITTSELRKMYEELSFYYLKSSLKKAFNTTKMIFEIGLQNNDIPSTPFATLKCPRSRKVADNERTPYTEEELKTILTLSKEYHNPMIYPIFAVVECTGMRPGELRGLEWNRFNSEEKTIKIVQAATKEYGEIEEIGKKTKSKEIVSVTKNIYGVMKDTKKLIIAALFAALTCTTTMVIKIPTPSMGYIHPGDGMVLLCGILLGPGVGGLAAGIGSMLSDLLSGYAVYAPGTLVIKALVAVSAGVLYRRLPGKNRVRILLCGAVGEAIMVAGYFVYQIGMMAAAGSAFSAAAVAAGGGVPFNLVQGVSGVVIALALFPVLQRVPTFRAWTGRMA